jgi:hypothetical protein
MSVKVYYEILNQKGTPAFFSDTYANRPAFGYQGRVFISTDTGQIFEDTGSAWTLIADAGVGGGTLASVTANGNSTATGIVITAGGLSTDSLTDTALTSGSVLFSGTGGLVSQKNANLFWDNTNNRLGIGNASPGVSLDIHGTGTLVHLNGTTTNNAYLLFQNAGTGKWRIGNTYNSGANSFNIFNNGLATNAVSISSTTNETIFSGSVGIGSGTNPVYALDVVGGTRVSGQLNAFASGSGNGLYVQGISNQYAARILGDATASNSYGLSIQAGTNSTDSPLLVTNYAAGTTFLRVTGAGNVGVGTNSPGSKLTVGSDFGGGTGVTVPTAIQLDNTYKTGTAAFDNLKLYLFKSATETYGFNVADLSDLQYWAGSNASGMHRWFTTQTEKMRLLGNGNLLINTTTDNGIKVQVAGDIFATGYLYFKNQASTNNFAIFGTTLIYFYNSAVGNIATINNATGVYTPISDINRKKDFEISTIGLNSILNLKPTLYRMKEEDNTEKHLGFIAQEVKQYIPQAYVEHDNFIGLDYNPIVATLVKAVQELNEKLERNNIN